MFKRQFGRTFSYAAEDEWKYKSEGIASFKMPTMQHDTLWHDDIMWEGYRPKMLLYTLDKLFYIYDQVKHHMALHCTECWGWVEKTSMPDTLLLVNLKDTHHLECLAWAVYDGDLLVGSHPELLGEHQWCTMLAGVFRHIYKGRDEMAHCPPYTLASWDCQQRMEAACEEHKQNAPHCRHNDGHRARAWRLRSSSTHHSKIPSQRGCTRCTYSSPPNTPSQRYHSVDELFSPSSDTTPKLSSAVSVHVYARSSLSAGGVAQALLNDDEDEEEDFQTPHTLMCHVVG